jgi:excisionase family DNA binding protein
MNNPSERPTLSSQEAAEFVGLSLPKFYEWTERADCDFVIRVGRKKLILKSRLLEWLDRQAIAGAGR